MPLESASFISQLVPANPVSTDQVSQGDDHLRLLKTVLQTTFPNINAAVTATPAQLNAVGTIDTRLTTVEANYIKKDGSVAFTGQINGVYPDGGVARLVTEQRIIDYLNGRIASFNGRIGAVTLTSADVTTALGYSPAVAVSAGDLRANDANNLDGQDSSFYTNIPARLGYTPPIMPNTGGGGGQWQHFIVNNAGFTLPGGGTWAWFYVCTNAFNLGQAGVSPGGTFLGVGGEGPAFAWRVS